MASVSVSRMEPWTHEIRNEFINQAINSNDKKGSKNYYQFNTFPKVNGNEIDDIKKSLVTEALAKTIYTTQPIYRKISLEFYNMLMHKMTTNSYIGSYVGNDIILCCKGSNAYAYVTAEKYMEDFPFSDFDIVIYINPNLPDQVFAEFEKTVKIVVLQTLSQYKRMLDHMFFINGHRTDYQLFDDDTILSFKKDYSKMISDIKLPNNAVLISPFESDEIRNFCSRNSCVLKNSNVVENTIVRIEVPHYENCERIPLRKSPLFCSYNETIDTQHGHFDLYRIRFNNKYVEKDEDGEVIKVSSVTADFIDVSVASKTDATLVDFWNKGRCLSVYDKYANVWLTIPDIHSCIDDLHKMLTIYECPESKREKRTIKMQKLMNVFISTSQQMNHVYSSQAKAFW